MPGKPGIIITNYRTGGTMLSLALDSHPLIYCARMEPLSGNSIWMNTLDSPSRVTVLRMLLGQGLCEWAMCKIIYRQLGDIVWQHLENVQASIIHLVRENELRAVCSLLFHKRVVRGEVKKDRPLHAFNKGANLPPPMHLDVAEVMGDLALRYEHRRRFVKDRLEPSGLPYLRVTYEQILNGKQERSFLPILVRSRLCAFLDVPEWEMGNPFMHRVNARPLSALVANWKQLQKMVARSEFAHCLEYE